MSDASQASGAGPTATSGPTAMLKLGGEVIADLPALAAMLTDVRALQGAGWRFVVCHGGGPQASALQERLRVPTVKVGGRRVTDAATRQVYNINADTVAAAVAAALRVEHLFLVTGIGGVLRDKDDPTTRIPVLRAREAQQAIADGTVVGGMIPKLEEALEILRQGIGAVHIIGPGAGVLEQAAREPGRQGTALLP